ncbi:PTS fructose transporter subunit IIA [Paracoccus contaminans]|uniref:PTS fructose transporter subunit IIA n=1 Tax=Paracoccus contaminans TaxID=1945662 RepID=A0A1W6CYB1_9RHOB|nr:PTS fructose transporter subunit IIA [Paracoccus contaminans]
MIGIVIVGHGGLAREYLAAVEHVVGPQQGILAVTIEEDHDRAAKSEEICRAVSEVDTGDGVVIVTDIFGGSPSNLSMPACLRQERRILYGANLPMLVKLAKLRHLDVGTAAELAAEAGRKYIDCYAPAGTAPQDAASRDAPARDTPPRDAAMREASSREAAPKGALRRAAS